MPAAALRLHPRMCKLDKDTMVLPGGVQLSGVPRVSGLLALASGWLVERRAMEGSTRWHIGQ